MTFDPVLCIYELYLAGAHDVGIMLFSIKIYLAWSGVNCPLWDLSQRPHNSVSVFKNGMPPCDVSKHEKLWSFMIDMLWMVALNCNERI